MADWQPQILSVVTHPAYTPLKWQQLAKEVGAQKHDWTKFRRSLEELIEGKRLHRTSGGLIKVPVAREHIIGTIKRAARGHAWFTPESLANQPHIEPYTVAAEDAGSALTGDKVSAIILKKRGPNGKIAVRVIDILERATTQFVGEYHESRGKGYVTVDNSRFERPIDVGDPGAKGVRPGDQVVIEMVHFPEFSMPGEAVLLKVLGQRGEPGVDLQSIIYEFGLPDEFPEAVLEESRLQAQLFSEDDIGDRLDLRDELIITIDPLTARDFDDAISLKQHEDGSWTLGVHIADVAHFVRPGTELDKEAIRRGNSVYLPGKVLPMLPEVLSNALASLQQDKVRFVKSAFIEYSPDGMVKHTSFANAAIKVRRRFAYEQVMPLLLNRQSPGEHPAPEGETVPEEICQLLERMYELAMILRKRRFSRGALELSLGEVELDCNDDGNVTGAHRALHDASHQIIEEFMLAANVAVAEEFDRRGWFFLRRVHDSPDELRMQNFAKFVATLGYDLPRAQDRQAIQALLDEVAGQPEAFPLNYALLRSLKQAEYSPEKIGHYALAVDNYAHFTSPIRRYPDLTIHRLLEHVIADTSFTHSIPAAESSGTANDRKKSKSSRADLLSEAELRQLGKQCSLTERRAEKAERELIKIRLIRYLADKVGLELNATITGVERFGLFCQGIELPAEGLVHLSDLPGDYYDVDQIAHAVIGRRSGRVFRLGDPVRVQVSSVDPAKRELNFRIVGRPGQDETLPEGEFSRETTGDHRSRSASDQSSGSPRRRSQPRFPGDRSSSSAKGGFRQKKQSSSPKKSRKKPR
ncbi:Ribonuclease R [Planctopirus ephydatiae]|uniref:Ribonuclease R n=1 Tax=Planctopirus ephydatiae TaxID=2528019 RepID=A0A518GRT5_9PLAN|nr:ribonuclease R [Planctopirus ephydatiae]QDV31292.1 Ribonuclease R [Planctopirus ephydatiae]